SLLDLTVITEKKEIQNIFGYMSPEVAGILRAAIDSRADIYSLGMIFYKLISGELPYTGDDISTLIHRHIAQSPKTPSFFNKGVPEILDRIVLRMIAKNPHDRYQGLSALIADLKEYQNQRRQGNQVIDFVIARQDRLRKIDYSTLIVGRNEEFNSLTSFIKQTTSSKGNLIFISGEAGVGKTRLVDEALKGIHQIKGIVLKGKCDQYDFQTPYKIFRDVIKTYLEKLKRRSMKERDLLIAKIKENVGELAGEVAKIAPEITELLGKPNKMVELEAEKEQTRFLITVIKFLLSFGSPENPVILFLDDLQWADESSIELLGRMAGQVHLYPILIIGAFRDREISAAHRLGQTLEKLKAEKILFHEIHLNRLSFKDTKKIISHILLEDEQCISALAADLDKRAKGNPFFLVELLHSLVEERIVYLKDNRFQYDSSRSPGATMPSNIVDVILKRVGELSDQDSGILSYAAVMGRKIKLELLRKISSFSLQLLLSAIDEGIRRQLLNGNITWQGEFSFAHDRIREAFYKRLPEDERASLHKEIGCFIEEQNRDNLDAVLFELAYHFAKAKIKDKTLQYSFQAAKKAQSAYAYDQAIRHYEIAGGILHSQNKKDSTMYIDILINLGVAYYQKGRYKKALHTLKVCESLIPQKEKLQKAEVLSNIGDVLQKKGELQNCEQVLVRSLRILGIRLPQNKTNITWDITLQLGMHIVHSLFPYIFVRKKYSNDLKAEIVSHLLCRLFYLYYFTDLYNSVCVLLRSQNFAEKRLGPSRKLSQIYALAGMLWMQLGFPWWARRNSLLAEKIAEDLNDKSCKGWAKAFYAWVEHPYCTHKSIELSGKAVELLMAVGEYWDLGHAWCCLLWGKQKEGKNLTELLKENEKQIIIMHSINASQNLGWALGIKGLFLIYIADERLKSEGIKSLVESQKLLEEVNDKPWFLCATGYLAYAHFRAGNYEEAIHLADRVSVLFISYHNLTTWLLDIVGMCAQVYLYSIMERPNLSESKRKKYFKKAKYFCRLARFKGWMYPTYKGWAYLVNGTYQWLCGKRKKAVNTWDRGIAYLRKQNSDTYRLASILLEEASFLLKEGRDIKKVHEYLLEAREIFTRVGAKLDLDRTIKSLQILSPQKETAEGRQALTLTRQLASLLKVTKAIGSLLNLEQLLENIVDQAIEVTGAKRGFLLLYDEEKDILQHKVSKGLDEEKIFGWAFSFEECRISLALVRQVENSHEGMIGNQNYTLIPEIASELREYCIKEALCVPLKAKEKFLGVIYLDTSMTEGIFSQDELDLMNSFAIQASISIENAYLVEELIDHERSLQEMIERAPDAVLVYDMTGKIINVNCQAC
ncbi:MAG: AAA family ATPase, partial [Candidatus Omnitrophica bacterium]|nr:AAA family ATPase [Candidatus Omnitrophota bacterium]